MKKLIISGLTMLAVILSSLDVKAAADSKYPAANFEPSVIYIDKDVAANNEADPKYPASNFTPIVVFVDNQLADQVQAQDEFDPKYPAAYFKPKVIFP